ncbi:MAG: tRNA 2-thiouridine(34) synthase MnmA [Acidobacteria bacterium]|nr:tRNA 2-thiouridine(34) synthase MnmA [Acidobacteriota bacterium]
MKVLAALSGGVDSSVAAAMLVAAGDDVTGVHLRLADAEPAAALHGCCGVADAEDARRVAQVLDIPFYVWNFKEVFAGAVVADFVAEYARGRTPNPCVRCNERVKFGALLERALRSGFDAVATGHYALLHPDGGRVRLCRAADRAKDQSYLLARLGQSELSRALFPVGGETKERTREIARSFGLRTASKPDSYEICFVPDGDAGGFVERALGGARPGPILDPSGAALGEHAGIHRFTVGQRRGLGLHGPEPRFVLALDPERGAVVVGPEDLLARSGLEAEEVRWTAGQAPEWIGAVQVRAHGPEIPATLEWTEGDRARVRFARPEGPIAPGQLVAFYAGDEVLGGGLIARGLG